MKETKSDDIVSFGYWVQQRRLALDLTRPALAQRISCSTSTIKKIERDERRPSLQIAALLADQLMIPEKDRQRFMRMARGELLLTPLSAPELVSLPSFLWRSDASGESDVTHLVARERELALLHSRLEAAVAGKGGILFITGEAGEGKTLLAQAFARQSQEKYADLVVAGGNCNAYTGVGDPYLPFREILELLTGDVEAHRYANAMSRTNAERLWRLVPHSVQALLDFGPELVDTFLLGPPLLARTAAATSTRGEALLDQLQILIDRHGRENRGATIHQSNLFAQYARVLQNVARRQPLLLIVDDLQWADAGSISLLFHLGRHLQGQRILLVGLYRAAEVALGRNGERHPLEPLLNELRRTFGEIEIRLHQTDGRRFIDALIDSQPNRLDRTFRDALYKQTAGHPLFTVEMLRGLQERGDLLRDSDGAWRETLELNWNILPARVEGVIKERIERLTPPLQAMLQVAGVIGETFCAETIAHVQKVDEQQIIRQLGAVLDQEQRLVSLQGNQRVGTQQRFQFRFRHILFQQYLYNGLDSTQRVYLHRAIAEELEQWWGDEAKLIAPQLAHHYVNARDHARALRYFTLAGDAAFKIYATSEAEAHYRCALQLAIGDGEVPNPSAYSEQLLPLYSRLGETLELRARYDEAIALYEEMERNGQIHDDRAMVLSSLLARAAIRTTVNFARNPAEGRSLLERARTLALKLGDRAAEARILWNLLILSAYTGDDRDQRLTYGEEALTAARQLKLPEQLAYTLHDIFYAYAGAGQWERARATLYEACDLWRDLGNLPMLSEALMRLHWTCLVTGDYTQAAAHAEEAYRLGVESHNRDAQALSHFMIGFVHWERGEMGRALTAMEEDIALAESINSLTPLIGTRADLALLYGELGHVERGLVLAQQARKVAEEQLPILRFWPHAAQVSLCLSQGDVQAAEQLISTLADYPMVRARFGYMPFMWIRVGLAHGEFALRQQAYEQAVKLMDTLFTDLCEDGIWYLRPDVLHLKGRGLLGLGEVEEAREVLLEARAAAQQLGTQRALWPVLVSLSEVAARCGDDATAAAIRQEAKQVVEDIAGHIGVPKLRTSFLELPQVKAFYLSTT